MIHRCVMVNGCKREDCVCIEAMAVPLHVANAVMYLFTNSPS